MFCDERGQTGIAQEYHYGMTLALLIALGVRVIEVDQLGTLGRYLPSLNLLLLDSSLDSRNRELISARVLPLVEVQTRGEPDRC